LQLQPPVEGILGIFLKAHAMVSKLVFPTNDEESEDEKKKFSKKSDSAESEKQPTLKEVADDNPLSRSTTSKQSTLKSESFL